MAFYPTLKTQPRAEDIQQSLALGGAADGVELGLGVEGLQQALQRFLKLPVAEVGQPGLGFGLVDQRVEVERSCFRHYV